jgi:hypothetical protein
VHVAGFLPRGAEERLGVWRPGHGRDGLSQRGGQAIDACDVLGGDDAHKFRWERIDDLTRPFAPLWILIEELVAAYNEGHRPFNEVRG